MAYSGLDDAVLVADAACPPASQTTDEPPASKRSRAKRPGATNKCASNVESRGTGTGEGKGKGTDENDEEGDGKPATTPLASLQVPVTDLTEPCGLDHECLFVAPSKLPGAGLGLFSCKRLRKNTRLGYYQGDVLPQFPGPEELARRHDGIYFMGLSRRPPWIASEVWAAATKPVIVDATSIHRYANCCKGDLSKCNCGVTPTGAFITHRKIAAGEEILIWYGTSYWEEHGP
jgi:hypothetical protein